MKSRRKSVRKSRRKSRRKSKVAYTRSKRCIASPNKKYQTRPGPPFPAQSCKGYYKIGNDGLPYKSIANKNGVYRWIKL